jgi:hypothetical protein
MSRNKQLPSLMAVAYSHRLSGPTKAQYWVLNRLALGERLSRTEFGEICLDPSADPVGVNVIMVLADRGWVTKPAPEAPLFNLQAVYGEITAQGRDVLEGYSYA